MEPQKYDVMRFVKENDEKLQRHYEKMKELEQRERELNFQQMYRKYTSNHPEDYKSSNTFPQTDTYTQNEQPQYQIVTEPQRNNNNNNQYVYEMNTYKNGMFNPLAPSSSFDNRNQVLQSSNAKSNFSNSQNQSQSYNNAHGTNMTGNFAYSNNHSGGNVNNDNDDFNYRNMKEEMLKRNSGEGAQQYSQGGTGNSAVFQYGYNSNNSENKNQYHFSIENNNNNGNNRSEGEEEGDGDGDEQEGEDFKYKGIEELRKEIMKNSQNVNNVNNVNQQLQQQQPIKQRVGNNESNNHPQQEENLYEESKYRSDEDDVNKIIQQQNQQQQQAYQFANNNNNNNINNNEGRSSDDDDNETYPKNIPKQQPKPKAPTQPSKPSTQKHKQYTEDKHIQHPQYHPYTNPQYQYQDSQSQDHDTLPSTKKPVKRFNKKYNGKIDSVALLNHYESLWKRKSKAKKKPKSTSKLPTRPPFNSNPSPLPTSLNDDNPLITRESKLKMHKLQFITAPLRYYYKV